MRLLYVTQFFPPENIAGAFRAHDNATNWTNSGDEVSVYTAYPNYPLGIIANGYSNAQFEREFFEDIEILRNKICVKPNTNFVNRIINGCSFYFSGRQNYKELEDSRFEVVFASSGPIFSGYLGAYLAKRLRVPFVVEFRDIAFEQMVATGHARSNWKVRLMRRLELHLCDRANHVVVLTNGFKGLLEENGVAPDKISVIPNGADIVLTQHKEHDGLRLSYFGTMGISQDVCRTLDIARLLERHIPKLSYNLVGEGAARLDVEAWMKAYDLQNFSLEHGMPMSKLEERYATTDYCIVSLKDSSAFSATIPSKIFQSFARGVPVLFIGPEGEAAKLIRDSNAGLVLTDSDNRNVEVLRDFFEAKDWRSKHKVMSDNALRLMGEHYSRTVLASELRTVLNRVKKEKDGA